MSWDYTIYVGPFVQCSTKTSPTMRSTTVCSNTDCADRKSWKALANGFLHCPKCGSKTERAERVVEGRVSADISQWDVVEGTKERLSMGGTSNCADPDPGTHLFVPNTGRPRNFTYCRDDPKTGLLLDDIPDKIDKDTAWFTQEFAEEIAFCKETYGEENVRVRWGVLGSAG